MHILDGNYVEEGKLTPLVNILSRVMDCPWTFRHELTAGAEEVLAELEAALEDIEERTAIETGQG